MPGRLIICESKVDFFGKDELNFSFFSFLFSSSRLFTGITCFIPSSVDIV